MKDGFALDQLPRRIVLSRKGSDAAWGGRPSLRVGTELISLPIPESASRAEAAVNTGVGVRYRDLPMHERVGALHTHLRDIAAERYVHLDPDLRPELRPPIGARLLGNKNGYSGRKPQRSDICVTKRSGRVIFSCFSAGFARRWRAAALGSV